MMDYEGIMHTLVRCGVVRQGHFVGTSGHHLDRYFNKNRLLAYPLDLERLAEELAGRCLGDDIIEVIVSPTLADAFIGQRVAYYLGIMQGNLCHFIVAEKNPDGGFQIGRGQTDFMQPGAKALIVVDVLTTGGSAKQVAELPEVALLDVVGGAALCNRGGITPAMIGIAGPLYTLVDFDWPRWAATETDPCPLCEQGVAINIDVGHGQKYLDSLGSIDAGRNYGPLPG